MSRKHFLLSLLPVTALIALLYGAFHSEGQIYAYFASCRERYPWSVALFEFISDYANVGYYALYVVVVWQAYRSKKRDLWVFVSGYLIALVSTLVLVEACKISVGRPRPYQPGIFDYFTFDEDFHSFPSAHVSETLVTVITLSHRIGNLIVSALLSLSPAIMAYSRIYLGRHHPSDILGSYLFAALGLSIAYSLSKYVRSRHAADAPLLTCEQNRTF